MTRFFGLIFSFVLFFHLPLAHAAKPDFSTFLVNLKAEALKKGVKKSTIEEAFSMVKAPIERIVELDKNQPEFKLTLETYLNRVVSADRVARARRKMKENRPLLEEVAARYNVQPRFVVALWGIETDFGRLSGGFHVVPALVTLIYDGRRAVYFKKELFQALKIIDEGHVTADNMKGSWAGAMGQPQFMPSSFNSFAQDYNGDGRKDIWTTRADVFASAANYLSKSGWNVDETWGRKVTLPKNFDQNLIDKKTYKSLKEWQSLGVRRADEGTLPARDVAGRILIPKEGGGQAFIVYKNFDTILKWNRSNYFAIAVGTLADSIGTGYNSPHKKG